MIASVAQSVYSGRLQFHRLCLIIFAIIAAVFTGLEPVSAGQLEPTTLPDGTVVVGPDREIFGNIGAARLVQEARKYDRMYCSAEQADRDKAVALYEKAIAAQPGAKINAFLADRVAQYYAFYEDRTKQVSPDTTKACQWWGTCLSTTNSKQYLWAQAQMGIASMSVARKDFTTVTSCCHAILEIDPCQITLPDWKTWPKANTDRDRSLLNKELARVHSLLEWVQVRSVDKLIGVLAKLDHSAALAELNRISLSHKGTSVGNHASDLFASLRTPGKDDPFGLPAQPFADNAPMITLVDHDTSHSSTVPTTGATTGSTPSICDRSGWLARKRLLGSCALAIVAIIITCVIRHHIKARHANKENNT